MKNKISRYSLGSYQFSNKKKKISKKEIAKIILSAYENGINYIDTADSYGNGECEIIIGHILKKKRLHHMKVATKFGQMDNFNNYNIQRNIDNSLKRLKLDQLDTYYFHSGNNRQFFNDKLWNIMNKNLDNGKIKKLGLSLKTNYLKKNNFDQIKKCKDYKISVVNIMFNPIIQNGKKIFKFCDTNNIEIISRSPFLGGDIFKLKYKNILQKKLKILNNKYYIRNILEWIGNYKTIRSIVFGVSSLDQLKLILRKK